MQNLRHNRAADVCARMLCAALALFLLLCRLFPATRAEANGMVRVKLARLGSPSSIEFEADCDYMLSGARIPSGTAVKLSASGGSLTLTAGERIASLGASVRLMRTATGNRGARFTAPALSNRFCGDLEFTASGDVITTVLHIYIEDYLCGVVGYEMPPSSGIEALKAQAIVARNYVLRQKGSHASAAYDVTDNADVLSFKGYSDASEYADAVEAVKATRGQVLYYGDSPAVCYCCESNGGQTESAANAFGTPLVYSVVADDNYDLNGTGAKKTAVLRKDAAELNESLRAALAEGASAQLGMDASNIQIDAIERVTACDSRYDAPSRLYKSLTFQLAVTDGAQSATVSVSVPTYGAFESWYDLGINAENNETIWVSETDKAFEVTFRRSGHGVGMSQRGAQAMARSGRSCTEILDYYFPGAALRQLTLTDTTRDAGDSQPAATPIAAARLAETAALYERADESSTVVTALPAGATVDVYAVQDGWAAVGSGSGYGFVRTEVLAVDAQDGADDVTIAPDDLYAQLTADAGLYVNADDTVSPRQTLDKGGYVQVLAYNQTWAFVRTSDGDRGYVKLDRLTAAQLPEAGGIDGGEITVVRGGLSGYVQTPTLPMYATYSIDSEILLTLTEGERVTIGAYNAVWACVRADGETGFVLVSGLGEQPPEVSDGDGGEDDTDAIEGGAVTRVSGKQYAAVTRDGAPLYEACRADSYRLALLDAGERVQVGAYNAVWACVRVDGVIGYMLIDDLELAAAPDDDADGDISYQECEAVTTTALGVFGTASLDGDAVAQLEEGVQVHVLAYNARVAYIQYKDQRGFVALRYLRRL